MIVAWQFIARDRFNHGVVPRVRCEGICRPLGRALIYRGLALLEVPSVCRQRTISYRPAGTGLTFWTLPWQLIARLRSFNPSGTFF
jgi:hypothetical protein